MPHSFPTRRSSDLRRQVPSLLVHALEIEPKRRANLVSPELVGRRPAGLHSAINVCEGGLSAECLQCVLNCLSPGSGASESAPNGFGHILDRKSTRLHSSH